MAFEVLIHTCTKQLTVAIRQLRKKPVFVLVAVLSLTLGIGANTAVFSVIDAVFITPLPYKEADRLVAVMQTDRRRAGDLGSFNQYAQFQHWKKSAQTFEDLAAAGWGLGSSLLQWRDQRTAAVVIPVTENFFGLLGVSPELGRSFTSDDLGRPCSVVISHELWEGHMQSQTSIVGQSVRLNQDACTVVGVIPAHFSFYPHQAQIWKVITPQSTYAQKPWDSRVVVFGRLRRGASIAAAQAELAALQRTLDEQAPVTVQAGTTSVSVRPLRDEFVALAGPHLRSSLVTLLGAVLAVLLIVCLNVATLFLGRASERQHEFGIRAALGANRLNLIFDLLSEGLVVSFVGAVSGITFAALCIRYIAGQVTSELPPGNSLALNWHAVLFTGLLTVLSVLLFALVPAIRASRVTLAELLKDAGRTVSRGSSERGTQILVILEVALSMLLLTVAGLLGKTLLRLNNMDLGYNKAHLYTAFLRLPPASYPTPNHWVRFYEQVRAELSSTPRVRGVTFAPPFPTGNDSFRLDTERAESTDHLSVVTDQVVGSEYFHVMGISMLRGRDFTDWDRETTAPVAIVNQAFVERYARQVNLLERHIKLGNDPTPWLTIIGIAKNVRIPSGLNDMKFVVQPCVYVPLRQNPQNALSVFVRDNSGPAEATALIRRVVTSIDSSLAPPHAESVDDLLADFFAQARLRAWVLSGFAVIALVLAGIGIYGVVTEYVLRRTRDIGVRLALGAETASVIRLVLTQGMKLTLTGILIGVGGAIALTRLISSLLYGTTPDDPATLVVMSSILALVALTASYIPARRLSRFDPIRALRE
jgi:predicted permease